MILNVFVAFTPLPIISKISRKRQLTLSEASVPFPIRNTIGDRKTKIELQVVNYFRNTFQIN